MSGNATEVTLTIPEQLRIRIVGHWPDGETFTATYDLDGDWLDDRFGQVFDIGSGNEPPYYRLPDPAELPGILKSSFWEGCERIEYMPGCAPCEVKA